MRPRLLLITIALSFAAAARSSADQCSDILANGTFGSSKIKDNSYLQQIIWSRFLNSTFQSSKTDKAGGANIPIGEVVLGANYSEEQYNAKKQQIEQSYFNQITASRELDVAVTSGDPEIIKAWSQCMDSRGGLSVRFKPVSGSDTDVFLVIEYHRQGTKYFDTLAKDVQLPKGVVVNSGDDCLKAGKQIDLGNPCPVSLTFPDAKTTAAIVVRGEASSAEAWLPARIKRVREVRPFAFDDKHRLAHYFKKEAKQVSETVQLTAAEIADGWMFDASTAQTNLQITHQKRDATCSNEFKKVDPHTYTFGYSGSAPKHGHGKDGDANCNLNPKIMMVRDVWVPAGTGTPAAAATPTVPR